MCALMTIRDGDPWWISPDIWTVPGSDPNAKPASPSVGQPTFVWVRIRNNGTSALKDVQLRFYWSNPATGVLRSNSTLIGSSFTSIAPGKDSEVLCLTPWIPVGVNDGHECLVVEALHPLEPLPTPPPDSFSPPKFDQVAQRNISLVKMRKNTIRMLPIQVAAPFRHGRKTKLYLERDNIELPDELVRNLGLQNRRFNPVLPIRVSIQAHPEFQCDEFEQVEVLDQVLPGSTIRAAYLAIQAMEFDSLSYSILHIVERSENGESLGGITFVVTGTEN